MKVLLWWVVELISRALTLELRGGFGVAKDVPLERVVRLNCRLLLGISYVNTVFFSFNFEKSYGID